MPVKGNGVRRRPQRRLGSASFRAPERRRPQHRLTTSHSSKTERPHPLDPPAFVLTQRENERKDRPPFEEKNQDVQPPSFDFTHRSKEGDRDVAPPAPTDSKSLRDATLIAKPLQEEASLLVFRIQLEQLLKESSCRCTLAFQRVHHRQGQESFFGLRVQGQRLVQ